MKSLFRTGLLLLVLAALSACSSSSAPGGAPDLLTADIAAAGLERVTVTADSGEMRITASADDAVHVKLDLNQDQKSFLGIAHWMSDDTARDLKAATIKLDRQGGSLAVMLVYPSGGTHSDVGQKWTLAVPARLALEASLNAGRMVIDGAAAGVTASLGAGDLDIHSVKGAVHADVKTGRLHVISDTTQPGTLLLKSTFGLAALSLNGKLYAPPPSEFHFFGNSERQQAGGKDDMDLEVTAGEVDLRVGPLVEYKDYRGLFDFEK